MKKGTLLVIEDDENIASLVKLYAEKAGYRAIVSLDGAEGLDFAKKVDPDCIILDLMLPNIDGIEILKQIRMDCDVPVIILTAKEEEVEKILGLELGADDYVTKPFSPKELMARVKAVLRRSSKASLELPEKIKVGDLVIDGGKFTVLQEGKEIAFSPVEMRLLQVLAAAPGHVFSREQLMEKIYEGDGKFVFDRTIDVHVKNLRKKLGDGPKKPKYIESVFGVGYKFKEQ